MNIIPVLERLISANCFQLYCQTFLLIYFLSLSFYTPRMELIDFSYQISSILASQWLMRSLKASLLSPTQSSWSLQPLTRPHQLISWPTSLPTEFNPWSPVRTLCDIILSVVFWYNSCLIRQMKGSHKKKDARKDGKDRNYVMQLKRLACLIFFGLNFISKPVVFLLFSNICFPVSIFCIISLPFWEKFFCGRESLL